MSDHASFFDRDKLLLTGKLCIMDKVFTRRMKTKYLVLFLLLGCLALQFCATGKRSTAAKMSKPVPGYAEDVAPVMKAHCSPCHFPDGGKKKFLDTYAAVRDNIDEIIYRVQLPRDSMRFMPFKGKKEPLSDSLIQVLREWKNTGLKG